MFRVIGITVVSVFLISSVAWSIYLYVNRDKKVLLGAAGIFASVILLFVFVTINRVVEQPIKLQKEDIVGLYKIDTSFYFGKNANWQFKHYSFRVTSNDSVHFYITNDRNDLKIISSKLQYSSGPPYLWHISSSNNFHVTQYPPLLYRGHKRFYYVFLSPLYGNMFFRKQ